MCVWSITPNFNAVSEIRVYKRINIFYLHKLLLSCAHEVVYLFQIINNFVNGTKSGVFALFG